MIDKQSLQILVVDDDSTGLPLLKAALDAISVPNFVLTGATRLDEALRCLRDKPFDAVLLHLGLPDSQGIETFTTMQRAHPAIPILILSESTADELAVQAVQAGAQHLVPKESFNGILLARSIRHSIERKLSEQKLITSEASYRRLFESARDGIFILEADTGRITDANPYIEELLGYTPGEFIGKRLWEIAPFRDKAANQAAFRTLQEKGYIRYDDLPLMTKDGKRADVEFISNVYEVGTQQVIQCNIRDITGRKRAQATERESKRFLQSTLDALSSHVAVLDEDGTIIAVNEAWWRFAEENDGDNISCGVGANYIAVCERADGEWAEEASAVAAGIRQVIAGQEKFELEYPCHAPQDQRWFNLRVTRFNGENPARVVVAHENITERKQAERELRESDEKFQLLVNNITDAFWIRSPDMREQHYLSPSFKEMWGIPAETQYAAPHIWSEFIVPEDRERVLEAFAKLMQSTPRISVEYRIQRADSEVRWVHSRGFQVRNDAGELIRLTGVVSDITERKQAEEQIVLQAQLLNEVGQAVIATDPQGFIIYWNLYAQEIYGWTAQQAMGQSIISIMVLDERRDHANGVMEKLRRGERWEGEAVLRRRDGTTFVGMVTNTVVFDVDGEVRGIIGISQDITERKLAEAELRASQEQFQSIVANVPGMVYQYVRHLDGSSEWPFVSDGCRELFNLEPEAFHTNPALPLETIHPDDLPGFERSIGISAQNLTPWNWEGRRQLPTGDTQWIHGVSRPQRLPDGGTLWNGLVMDITARKEAETERDRFFTLTLDLLGIADGDGCFKRLNPAFEATLGFSDAELMAVPFLEFVHPDDRAATLKEMDKINSGESIIQFENRYRCRDGSYKWLQWIATPFENMWYFAARDITQIKEAEAVLRKANDELELHVRERTAELHLANATLYKNHEFLEAVLENTAEGIVACDAEGQLTFFNRATREFHGLPAESLPAEQWPEYYSLYFPDGTTPMQRDDVPLFRALNGAHVRDMEMVIAPREGETRLVLNNGEPLFDAAGEKLGAVVVMHDITERKQVEVELQRAKEEADSANLAKSEFLSRMSHELRTPLNAILGFGQILDKEGLDPLARESVGYILKGGRHLLNLINEVLDIARVEAGRVELSLEPIALDDVVPDACALVWPLAAERDIRLQENTLELSGSYILADRQRLKQVLLNLLSNAIKYNREGGQVEVACQPKPDGWTAIAIRDTGPGISPEDLPKLFTPFERLDADASEVEGTGLGLVLSQQLVTAMGGILKVESTLGRGTTFTLELPKADSLQEQFASLPKDTLRLETSQPTGRTYSILCIEDNPSNLRLIEAILQDRTEITLLTAMQGSVGLDLARQHEPDLILLDLNLLDIHGSEVLARLQQSALTRDIPVVVVSADATPRQIERLLAAGAKAYLTKPLDIDQFLHTMDEFLQTTPGIVTQPRNNVSSDAENL